jgi:pyruvate dehydrogenase E1 component
VLSRSRARGFLLGATAGRTTLGGEGLQHQDGSSLVQAAAVPNCRAYDPCFAGEVAIILDHGMRQMLERQEDVFYYLTLMNESYAQPSLPAGVADDVIRGLYRCAHHAANGPSRGRVRLLGSGTILREVLAAAELLAGDAQLDVEVWSATSYSELDREAREAARWNRLHPTEPARRAHLHRCLPGTDPVIAASDYVRAWPQMIASHLQAPFCALGTDGFGRSDTRAALRRFFEVDRHHIALAALDALRLQGRLDAAVCAQALQAWGLDAEAAAPWRI